nr:carboxypeptidase-like regulatory domain-containing protein [Pyrinomonadaceae bacterium]
MKRKELLNSKFSLFLTAIMLSLVVTLTSNGQIGTSVIRGNVADAQGSPVAGATVIATNEQQNSKRTTITSGDGVYTFNQLAPGSYKLEVEAKGFKKTSAAGIKALVDNTTSFDFTLEVGGVNEVVTIIKHGKNQGKCY